MISFAKVVKEFSGPLARLRGGPARALDGVTLDVGPGTALGIVGPNGAGKSTLIRLLLGYIRPTSGRVEVGGMEPRAYVERHGIAYVSELVAIPPSWTVRGALEMYAALSEIDETRARIAAVTERLGIAAVADRRIANLSKGNLQRVAIAQAILAPRRVMVLDEPTSGLDPEWIAELRDVVAEWRAMDPERIVVIASHNLDELERTVDHVAVLRGGRVREVVSLTGGDADRPPYLLEVEDAAGVADVVASLFPGAVAGADGFRVEWMEPRQVSARLAELLARGVVVKSVGPRRVSLAERVWGAR